MPTKEDRKLAAKLNGLANPPSDKFMNTQLLIHTTDLKTGVSFYHTITPKGLMECATDLKVDNSGYKPKPRNAVEFTPMCNAEAMMTIPDPETGALYTFTFWLNDLEASAQEIFSKKSDQPRPGIELLIPVRFEEW